MERLPLETQTLFNKVLQKNPADDLIHLPDHSALHSGNQPGNFFGTIPTIKQKGGLKDRFASGTKGGLQRILRKLWRMEIPGKDKVEDYLRDQYRRNLRLSTIGNTLTAISSFINGG